MVFKLGPLWKKVSTYVENKFDVHFGAGTHLVLPSHSDAVTPTLSFNGDSGFYEHAADLISIALGGVRKFSFNATTGFYSNSGLGSINHNIATATVPNITPFLNDADTGIGRDAEDQLSVIAGGVEGIQVSESAGSIVNTFNGKQITPTTQILTGAGGAFGSSASTQIVTTGADALTLANGSEGQHKFLVMKTHGGNGTLTPTNLAGGTTITFNAVGDSCHLFFIGGTWYVLGIFGATVA